jgi:cyclopropane-fatty-acyl-phospholipid synthase
MSLASLIESVLGSKLPVAIRAYDGTHLGPPDPDATLVIRSPNALRRIVTAPGELGFARAYVSGDLDVEGDIFAALELRDRRRHTIARDRAAVRHHYDVSNEFYRLVLGPSLTYSCAVFTADDTTLEQAQFNKYELVARKLGLRDGQRLLDVGCGWGGMVLHGAEHFGVRAVGVTVADRQVDLASKRVAEAGLVDRVEIRNEDYRAISDGPYDAISSIGMFEHVGESRLSEYFGRLFTLLRPGGRLLNHGISRPPGGHARFSRGGFIDHYVFPDGELHEVGRVVSIMQAAGFEVRHVESLREHYTTTLRRWVSNLEQNWDEAVQLVGEGRARVWRLYMAGSAVNFEANRTQIHQVLAVKPAGGEASMPLRPDWEHG